MKRWQFKSGKKAQTALFVIIAVVIVAGVALFFFLKPGINILPKVTEPQGYLENCIKEAASDALNILGSQGGFLNSFNYVNYDGSNVSYLCYTDSYYTKCVNQQPMLKSNIESEITNYVLLKVQKCAAELKSQLEKKGYSVTTGSLSLSTTLQPKKVVIDVSMPLTISKEETKTFGKFQSILLSPIYEQSMLAQDIVNSEISYGDFEQLSYMLYHQETDIEKKMVGDDTIYTLEDRASGKKFLFAIRNYVLPAGF